VPRITSELERMQPKDRAWVESVMNNKLKDAMINGETLGEIERHDRAKYAIDHTLRTIA